MYFSLMAEIGHSDLIEAFGSVTTQKSPSVQHLSILERLNAGRSLPYRYMSVSYAPKTGKDQSKKFAHRSAEDKRPIDATSDSK